MEMCPSLIFQNVIWVGIPTSRNHHLRENRCQMQWSDERMDSIMTQRVINAANLLVLNFWIMSPKRGNMNWKESWGSGSFPQLVRLKLRPLINQRTFKLIISRNGQSLKRESMRKTKWYQICKRRSLNLNVRIQIFERISILFSSQGC